MTEALAAIERLRAALTGQRGITEKRMFGGVCFLLRDHMLCGASKRGFMFRVGGNGEAKALAKTGVTRMVMNGREYPGFVRADPARCKNAAVRGLVALARDYVAALPPKARKAKRPAPKSARKVTRSTSRQASQSKPAKKRSASARRKH